MVVEGSSKQLIFSVSPSPSNVFNAAFTVSTGSRDDVAFNSHHIIVSLKARSRRDSNSRYWIQSPGEIRTRVTGFKVQGVNRYTTGPMVVEASSKQLFFSVSPSPSNVFNGIILLNYPTSHNPNYRDDVAFNSHHIIVSLKARSRRDSNSRYWIQSPGC
uniref:Lectin_legB domain-containing protein n=1 Tax=Heterorhabditis bacteriophora TaxID=37862 RepID=A0A1I7WES7_HETBA